MAALLGISMYMSTVSRFNIFLFFHEFGTKQKI